MVRFFYLSVFLMVSLFVALSNILPFQDLPQWTYQGVLFKEVLIGGPLAQYFEIIPYPIPNSLVVVLIGSLNFLFSHLIASKLMLIIYAALFLISSYYFLTAFTEEGNTAFLWIPPLFVLNNSIFWGNISNNFGYCFLFLCLGYIYRKSKVGQSPSFWVLSGLSLGLFFSHILAVAILLAFLFFSLSLPKTPSSKNLLRLFLFLVLLSSIYTIGNMGHYNDVIAMTRPYTEGASLMRQLVRFLGSFLIPLVFVSGELNLIRPFYSEFVVIFNCLGLFIFSLLLFSVHKWRRYEWPETSHPLMPFYLLAILLVLLVAFLPDYFMGNWGPGRRFTLPFLFISIALLSAQSGVMLRKKILSSIPAFCIIVCVIQTAYLYIYWKPVSDLLSVGAQPQGHGYHPKLGFFYRAFSVDSYCHLNDYQAIANQSPSPICFSTSLIRTKKNEEEACLPVK